MTRHIHWFAVIALVLGTQSLTRTADGPPSAPEQDESYFTQRCLTFHNETDRRLKLWLLYCVTDDKGDPKWAPAEPGLPGQAKVYEVGPGKTVTLKSNGKKIPVERVRFWAEAETGWQWRDYVEQDLWLVSEDDSGKRRYKAAEIETFTFKFAPPDQPATLRERMIQVRNTTAIPLRVEGQVLCQSPDSQETWRAAAPTVVEPGKTVVLKGSDGWLLHGSRARIWAEDDASHHFRWWSHREHPLELVDKKGYLGMTTGYALVVFENGNRQQEKEGIPVFHLQPDQVNVPQVTGMIAKDAKATLAKLGLSAKLDDPQTPDDTPVVGQDPLPGWQALGIEVRLITDVIVPDLAELDHALAKAVLDANRLALKSDNGTEGVVKSQKPEAGTAVKPGSIVTVTFQPVEAGKIVVPDLIGLDLAAAQEKAKGLVLKSDVADPAAKVKSQDPPAGTVVKAGSEVTIALDTPQEEKVLVPDVIGMEYVEARAEVEAKGLLLKSSDGARVGKVKSQDPDVGMLMPRGSAVTVVVEVSDKVLTPDVVGMTFPEAKTEIEAKGLVIKAAGGERAGKARSQSPDAGTPVAKGAVITVVFATDEPTKVKVPNVVGLDFAGAQNVLAQAGLGMTLETPSRSGLAEAQTPAADTEVERGSTVIVRFPDEPPPEPPLPPDPIPPDPIPPPLPPPPDPMVLVPNVIGLTVGQARVTLLGSELGMVIQGNATPPAQSIVQFPLPNTRVPRGFPVVVGFAGTNLVPVPNVIGLPAFLARRSIERVGLVYQFQGDPTKGLAQLQVPPAGTRVPPGSVVTVIYPQIATAIVPPVIGLPFSVARDRIERAGLTFRPFGNPKAGPAIAQAPMAGTAVPLNSNVLVTFPAGMVKVPGVIGLPVGPARFRIESAGLTFRTKGNPALGAAVDQNPAKDTLVLPGTTVVVTFPGKVRVPNVIGLPFAQARDAVQKLGLVFVPHGDVKKGVAKEQSPLPGIEVDPGSTVDVTFPGGLVPVPNVIGLPVDQARARILKAGLLMSIKGDPNKGSAIAQNPLPGTPAFPGMNVQVTFPEGLVRVPPVVGLKLAEARARITAAGLVFVQHGNPSAGPAISQSPSANAPVKPNSVVHVTFPEGLVKIPDVRKHSFIEARRMIENANLVFSPVGSKGIAEDQRPAWGALVLPKTSVTVYFSDAMVVVPNVKGKTPREAQAIVEAVGLRFTYLGGGQVVKAHNPPAGARTPRGSSVVAILTQEELVTVPNIVGLYWSEAKSKVLAAGLTFEYQGMNGKAVKQLPQAGAKVPPKSVVRAWFPGGVVSIPDVLGKTHAEARALVEGKGLVYRPHGNLSSRVVFQNPRPGYTTQWNSAPPVDVYFAGEKTKVPNAVGLTWVQARDAMEQAKLGYRYHGSTSYRVKSQTPAAGAVVNQGTIVDLYFSEGVATKVKVPNVIGMTADKARAVVESSGLRYQPQRLIKRGTVKTQNPAAGTLVARDSPVNVDFHPLYIVVPNVIGMNEVEARKALDAVFCAMKFGGGFSNLGPIWKQDPPAGTKIEHLGTGIFVTVWFPAERLVTVPNVVGSSLSEATARLEALKLVVRYGGDPKAGPVKSQNPPAGTKVKAGTTVSLTFPMVELVSVPKVVGLSYSAARSAIEGKGLIMQATTRTTTGNVVSQSPSAGAMVKKGTVVTVVFPTVELVAVPQVVGLSYSAARSAIESKGLVIYVSSKSTSGTVANQAPTAGTMVKRGSTVTVTFPSAPPPPSLVTVPNVRGMTYFAARSTLEGPGLRVSASGNLQKGKVTSQNPAAGARVPRGSTVNIVLATGPIIRSVPHAPGSNGMPQPRPAGERNTVKAPFAVPALVIAVNPALTQGAKPLPDRVRIVRQMYEKVPPLIFEITEPVQIVKGSAFEDGGTTVLLMKDAKHKVVLFHLDRKVGSRTRDTLFVTAEPVTAEPGEKKAVMLRGPEEAALYGLLLRWKQPADVAAEIAFAVEVMLGNLDKRFAGATAPKAKN